VCKYLKGGCEEDGATLFSVPGDKTGGNGHKLKQGGLSLNIGRYFFTVKVTEHWHRLLRKVVESPSLEIFKSYLHTVLGNWLCVALLDQVTSRGRFQPQAFCDLIVH